MPGWFNSPRPLVIAHRGARARERENTIAAFRLARSIGADGLELDVRATSDGVVVVHHDADTSDGLVIPAIDFKELRDADPGIPTLWETLEATTDLLVNVEIKNSVAEEWYSLELTDITLAAIGRHRDRVLVSSFDPATVARVGELDPQLPRGLITDAGVNPLDLIGQVDVHAIHPFHRAIVDVSELMAAAGKIAINPWTVNEIEDIQRMVEGGITSVIGDHPELIREVVDSS